jgi:hypothetical protein
LKIEIMFSCIDCGRKFDRRSKLRRHELKYHPDSIVQRDLFLSDSSAPSSQSSPVKTSSALPSSDVLLTATTSGSYVVQFASQDINNNSAAEVGTSEDWSIPPPAVVLDELGIHSEGKRYVSEPGPVKKRIAHQSRRATSFKTPLLKKTLAEAAAKRAVLTAAVGRRPTAPMAVFTPRPRPPVLSVVPGSVVRNISSAIPPSQLVDLVEDFPSVSAAEIFQTAVEHLNLGPRTQSEIRNVLEAVTTSRTCVADSLNKLLSKSKTLKSLRSGLECLAWELTHSDSASSRQD